MDTYIARSLKYRSELLDPDPRWVQFIHDHREMLLRSASSIAVDMTKMHRYRFRPREILQVLNIEPDLEYIVRWLNQLPLSSQWVSLRAIYVPNRDAVELLREQYRTFIAELEKLTALV